ncbi:polysaccharide deacetylase family protein (plasmid) [Haloferacaceae archaeon DSL9]
MTNQKQTLEQRPVEFTYEWYDEFLGELTAQGRRFRSYDEPMRSGDVLLRHDIDWSPKNALRVASIEEQRGVKATYFFLLTSPFYNLFHKPNRVILDRIASMGHDIALHFSTHQYWNDEPPEAALVEEVESELRVLEELLGESVETVSFHRPPEWVFERAYDSFISAYEPRFFSEIAYRSDSNHRWRDEHPLAEELPEYLQVLTHPGLWGEADADFKTRLLAHEDEVFGETRKFMEDQFLDKKYNIDEFCDFE